MISLSNESLKTEAKKSTAISGNSDWSVSGRFRSSSTSSADRYFHVDSVL